MTLAEICPECGGKGGRFVVSKLNSPGYQECWLCKGSGRKPGFSVALYRFLGRYIWLVLIFWLVVSGLFVNLFGIFD